MGLLDSLFLENTKIQFSFRLKLTGKNILSSLKLPFSEKELNKFLGENETTFTKKQKEIVTNLAKEVKHNNKLSK